MRVRRCAADGMSVQSRRMQPFAGKDTSKEHSGMGSTIGAPAAYPLPFAAPRRDQAGEQLSAELPWKNHQAHPPES